MWADSKAKLFVCTTTTSLGWPTTQCGSSVVTPGRMARLVGRGKRRFGHPQLVRPWSCELQAHSQNRARKADTQTGWTKQLVAWNEQT